MTSLGSRSWIRFRHWWCFWNFIGFSFWRIEVSFDWAVCYRIFILEDWSFLWLSRVLMVFRRVFSAISWISALLRSIEQLFCVEEPAICSVYYSIIGETTNSCTWHSSPCVNPLTVEGGRKLRLIWLSPNFVLKICDLRAKFLNRGFGSIHGTLN